MVSVLLIWIYMTITTVLPGAAVCGFLCKKESFEKLHFEDVCVFGLMLVTVYAQFFSLFAGVGLVANILLVCICVVSVILVIRKGLVGDLLKKLPGRPVLWIAVAVTVLVMAYGSSFGFFHVDSDLYHGQAIHWIEEYGLVKGLGNLHLRLGYNSSSFATTALYSFSWLTGRSFHACAGFLATIVMFECLRLFPRLLQRKFLISDFARIGGFYYILNIYDEMVSPASDYFAMLILIFVVIRMVDMAESEVKDANLYAIPALLSIFLVTVKLSSAMMVLVCLIPIVLLVKEKEFKRFFLYVAAGIFITVPFFIRGVLLSGYLLYPSLILDIFNVDWKVPDFKAGYDAAEIILYGRGYDSTFGVMTPFKEWFPYWFSKLGRMDILLFSLCVLGVLYFPLSLAFRKKKFEIHCVELSLIITFFSWLFSSPLIRYGQGILLCLGTLMIGDCCLLIIERVFKDGKRMLTVAKTALAIVISCFFIYKGAMLAKYIIDTHYFREFGVIQLDYGTYEMLEYDIDGLTVYTPTYGGLAGYDPFPSTPTYNEHVCLRGESVSDGFRYK